jgi:hypothetical protein
MTRRKRLWMVVLAVPCVVLALLVANMLCLTWNFVYGVESAYVASTVCAPRDGSFKQAWISARGVVPRHADIARQFSEELVLIGNADQRLALKLELSPAVHLAESVASIGLSSGAELTPASLLRCLELAGKPTPASSSEAELAEQAAGELITILQNSGTGPKGGPVSGNHFEVLSYESHYTDL